MKPTNKRVFAAAFAVTLLLASCAKAPAVVDNIEAPAEEAPTFDYYYDLGVRYLSEGNYQEAIIAFTAAIEIDAKNADAYIGLADAYIGAGDDEKAAEALNRGYEETGDNRIGERLGALAVEEETPPEEPAEEQPEDAEGSTVVVWDDPVFESMVRGAIGIPDGDVLISDLDYIYSLSIYGNTHIFINPDSAEDMWLSMQSNVLQAYYGHGTYGEDGYAEYTTRGDIRSVDALRYFRNLDIVTIVANHITDISVLNETDVKYALFFANDISDLSPLEGRTPENAPNEQFIEIGDPVDTDYD